MEFDISGVVEILEPTQFLVGLGIEDLEDLLEDIKVWLYIIIIIIFSSLLPCYSL